MSDCQHVLEVPPSLHPQFVACGKCGLSFSVAIAESPRDRWSSERLVREFKVDMSTVRGDIHVNDAEMEQFRREWDRRNDGLLAPIDFHAFLLAKRYEAQGLRYKFRLCSWKECRKPSKWKVTLPEGKQEGVCGNHKREAVKLDMRVEPLAPGDEWL